MAAAFGRRSVEGKLRRVTLYEDGRVCASEAASGQCRDVSVLSCDPGVGRSVVSVGRVRRCTSIAGPLSVSIVGVQNAGITSIGLVADVPQR